MSRCVLVAALSAGWLSAGPTASPTFLGKSWRQWAADLDHADAPARRGAAFALGSLAEHARPAIRDLAARLSDPDDEVRDRAAYAMGEIVGRIKGDALAEWEAGHVRLLKLVTDDATPAVRRSAAYALGSFGPPAAGARPALQRALGDADSGVRQNAAWALGRLGPDGAREAAAALCKRLDDDDPLVRRDVAGALAFIGRTAPQAATALLARFRDESDPTARKAALDALVAVVGPDDKAAIPDLMTVALDPRTDLETRHAAAFALGNIGGKDVARVVPVLRDALTNPSLVVQAKAAAALGNIGPSARGAVPQLARTLSRAESVDVRRNAAHALASIGPDARAAVPALMKALRPDEHLEVRRYVAQALLKIGPPAISESVQVLKETVRKDPDRTVRQRCILALIQFPPADFDRLGIVQLLTPILDETDREMTEVRYVAAQVLAEHLREEAPPKTVDVLVDFLNNKELRMFKGTASKVTESGGEAAGGRTEVKTTYEGDARYKAAGSMRSLGGLLKRRPDAVAALRQAAKDGNPELVKEATQTLKAIGEN